MNFSSCGRKPVSKAASCNQNCVILMRLKRSYLSSICFISLPGQIYTHAGCIFGAFVVHVCTMCTMCMYAVFCDQAPPLTWSWIECGWIVAPAPYRVTTTLLPYLVRCLFSPGNNVFSSPAGCIFIIIRLLHQICVPNACLQQYILIQTLVASSCTRVDGPSIHFLHKLCIISIN